MHASSRGLATVWLAAWLVASASAGSATSWSQWATPVVLAQGLDSSDGADGEQGGGWVWLLRDSDTVRGGALQSVGDVNGDDVEDIVCDVGLGQEGAANAGSTAAGQFGVMLLLGRNNSDDKRRDALPIQLDVFDVRMITVLIRGVSFVTASDVTGDGLNDILLQSSGPWPSHVSPSSLAAMWAGVPGAVFPVGDVNGDGHADVALRFGTTSFVVILGSHNGSSFPLGPSGVDGANGFVLVPAPLSKLKSAASFSVNLVGVGDVNGDHYDDMALEIRANVSTLATGSVTVVFGRSTWMAGIDLAKPDIVAPIATIPGCVLAQAHYAPRNAGGIHLNDDDFGDLLVLKETEMVVLGAKLRSGSLGNTVALCQSPNVSESLFLGDVTGDGVPDLVRRKDSAAECVVTIDEADFDHKSQCEDVESKDRVMRLVGPGPCGSVDAIGDIDGDGRVDYFFAGHVALGALHSVNVSAGEGIEVVSGRNATLSGFSSTGVGDVSGDGVPDFAFAVANPSNGLWEVVVAVSIAECTLSLSALGDHNGDRVGDVLVGVVGASKSGVRAVVLLGPSLAQVAYTTSRTDDTGNSVSALGDVNGDLMTEFGLETHGEYERYRAFVVYGSSGLARVPSVNIDGSATELEDNYGPGRGANVTSIGDINGDGLADAVLDMARCGWLRLLLGSRTRPMALNKGVVLSPGGSAYGALPAAQECAAQVVPRALGDVNGDLIDDFGVGLPTESNSLGHKLAGRIYVIFGSKAAGSWTSRPSGTVVRLDATVNLANRTGFSLDGEILFDQLGAIFGSAGDVNGDGVGDIYLGMPEALATAGQVYVLLGRNDSGDCSSDSSACWSRRVDSESRLLMSSFSATDGYQLVGSERGSRLGRFVGRLGDVDGDGAGDIVIGSPVSEAERPGRLFSGSAIVLGAQQMRLVAPSWSRQLSRIAMDGSRTLRMPGVAVWTHHCGNVEESAGCTMQRSDPTLTYTVRATTAIACQWQLSPGVVSACQPTVSATSCSFVFTTAWNSTCAALASVGPGLASFIVGKGYGGGSVALRVSVNNSHGNTAGIDLVYDIERPSKLLQIIAGSVGGVVGLLLLVVACAFIAVAVYKRRLVRELNKWEPRVWHFEESLRPTGARAQSRDYFLLKPGRVDAELVVELYQRCPVPRYDVAKVEIIYSPHLEQAFENRVAQLQARAGNTAFAPAFEHDGSSELRAGVVDRLAGMARKTPEPAYPNVQLVPMWHGTRAEVLESVFRAGFASLATTDEGFFGKGVYSAYEARYASEVYSKGALLVNWVSLFSAYPVVDGDMDKLTGKGSYANYDAHFIPVRPATDEPGEQNYVACAELEQAVFHELVAFEASQILPRYLVTLQPTLVKTVPSLGRFGKAI
eukprot:m51a1_g1110 hypothetical protein (1377) ;mRNA; r:140551-145231